MNYDRAIIATLAGYETVIHRLNSLFSVPNKNIDTSFIDELYDRTYGARNRFLKRYAELVHANKLEGGVFESTFTMRMNAAFPDRKLYLFDTFEDFDKKDIAVETGDTKSRSFHFNVEMTEQDLLAKMSHLLQIIIKKDVFQKQLRILMISLCLSI
jgi:hypothetical protein